MADYVMREMFDMNNTGKKILYPQIERFRMLEEDEFIARVASEGSGLNAGQVESVLTAVKVRMAEMIALGYTVKMKGIGTFSASLGIKGGKEQETDAADETKRNAQSIEVKNILFKADKEFVRETDIRCNLERKGVKRLRVIESTEEERLAMAHKYLDSHPFMKVCDYTRITGLGRTQATLELQKFRKDENSGIGTTGRGCHKLYVKKTITD